MLLFLVLVMSILLTLSVSHTVLSLLVVVALTLPEKMALKAFALRLESYVFTLDEPTRACDCR